MDELRMEVSRSGVFLLAVKIFERPPSSASTDHDFGAPTFSCLKMTLPPSSVISAIATIPFDLVERFDWRH
ncbi:MAG: hypothetical protein U1F83_06595 [Verrucomicrobiota bacterium]